MYDYGLSVLEQYGLTATGSSRIRGALLCRTEQGPVVVREFRGSEKKLKMQQELLVTIRENGYRADSFLENGEGELISRDSDNIPYTLQHWYEGRECDTKSEDDIVRGAGLLAEIHKVMKLAPDGFYMQPDLKEVCRRHNQELRKIRRFIRKKGASCDFEKDYLSSVEWFLRKGEEALALLENTGYERLMQDVLEQGWVCHGEYNQHNILFAGREMAATGFDHWSFGIQMSDLYQFMRKILEKHGWDSRLAEKMLDAYSAKRPVSSDEVDYLKIRFLYPDKYWKLANYYYSHNKAWISEKNTEKMKTLIRQKERWDRFGRTFFPGGNDV